MILTWSQLRARILSVDRDTRHSPLSDRALELTVGEVRALARADQWDVPKPETGEVQ